MIEFKGIHDFNAWAMAAHIEHGKESNLPYQGKKISQIDRHMHELEAKMAQPDGRAY